MTSLDVQTRRFVSFYYKLVVNCRNSTIVFTPTLTASTKLHTCTLICIIDLLFKVHFNEIKLRIRNKLQLKRLSPQPLSKCYKSNFVESFSSITHNVRAFGKRKSSGFLVTTKADRKMGLNYMNVVFGM